MKIFLSLIFLFTISFSNKYIIPDDYSVPDSLIKDLIEEKSDLDLFRLDRVWFKNDSLNQVLIFELYTDYYRMSTYNFNKDFLFDYFLINHNPHRKIKTDKFKNTENKIKFYERFYSNSKDINQSFFKTNNGLSLNQNKDEILNILGNPDKLEKIVDFEYLEWNYDGELNNTYFGDTLTGTIAKDSWGFSYKMYFKNNKLIGLIIDNEIP